MLDTRALELINREIDSDLTEGERGELEALLESSVEARTMRAEMLKLTNLLDSMPEREPPADLAERILNNVSLPRQPSFSPLARFFSSLQPVPMGLAFAAGLLLTVGIYEMSPGQTAGSTASSMVGTMVPEPQGAEVGKAGRLSIAGPGVLGEVALSGLGDMLVLSFDVAAEQKTEFVIAMADAGLGFGGIAHGAASDGDSVGFHEVSGGSLRVVNEKSHPFNVYLRRMEDSDPKSHGIGIEVIRSGERLFEGSLEIDGENS